MQNTDNKINIMVCINDHLIKEEEQFPYSKYIDYRINVETRYKKWHVDKRYKFFEALHFELRKKINPLPKFPEKRIFSMSEKTIKERKELFTEYLNFILQKTNFITNLTILDFLKIDKELIMILLKYPTTIHRNTLTSSQIEYGKRIRISRSAQNQKEKFFSFIQINTKKNDDDMNLNNIDYLIKSLETEKENICENISMFWDSKKKKKKWENLSRDDIIKLFYGSTSSFNKNGLLYHSGNIERNIIGAQACLNLIAKLVDYETNPDCENCIYILKMARLEHLEMMRLEKHLMSNKPLVILNALKILKVIINNERGLKIDTMLKDKNNIDKFNNFIFNS